MCLSFLILKTIRDNYSRQLLTIREGILFGLEECAQRIGNPQQNDVLLDFIPVDTCYHYQFCFALQMRYSCISLEQKQSLSLN